VILSDPAVPPDVSATLLKAHYEPEMYLNEARIFATSGLVHASIDLSDGLASDLRHICTASGVGAIVDVDTIPISDELHTLCEVTGGNPLELAISGGEDYRLLITADPAGVGQLEKRIANATGRVLHDLGRIEDAGGIQLRDPDGTLRPLSASGWDHFRMDGRTTETEGSR